MILRSVQSITAALACILAASVAECAAQSLYSSFPSRSTILAQSDRPRSNASVVDHMRTHTEARTVLGYVTPWNPRGTELAERFRGKFDIIAPAWHTVDVVNTDGKSFYVVNGGPTGTAEETWKERMQQTAQDGNGRRLPPVKIAPRFVLDRFTPEDLVELLSDDELMESLARIIIHEVQERKYDGIIFESGAVWAVEPLVKLLSEGLHAESKLLALVIPALKQNTEKDTDQTNKIAIHSLTVLAPLADHVMVMTYDHAGSGGVAFKDAFGLEGLPEGSPLAQEGVRTPGPNSPLDYISRNIESMTASLEEMGGKLGQFSMPGGDPSSPFYSEDDVSSKLLFGVALYGYRYPVGWFDRTLNNSDGITRFPPKSPMVSEDNDTNIQALYRVKAEQREQETPDILPMLRFPGDAFKHSDLVAQLKESKALVRLDESSQEQFVDYVAQLTPDNQDQVAKRLGMSEEEKALAKQTRALSSYYRAYFPSAHTIRKRLVTITNYPSVGIALWDVGQAGEWLLHEL